MTERESIGLWSTTAATNSSVDPQINFAENQLPSTVNNSARALMAGAARFYKDINGSLTTAGSANVYTLTINSTWTAYANGQILSFKASFANTSTATLNVTNADATALGAKAIRLPGDAPLTANSIISGGRYFAQYDTAINSAAGGWLLLNPSNSAGGASAPGGRLTLSTGVSVMQASFAAQGTVYYTPDQHEQVPLYDGTNIRATTFAELSQATTDTTKSPAAVAANKNYDMFVWNDSGTIRCTRGPAWSSDTVRGTGAGTTELVSLRGLWLNNVAITNGPAASRGTYVGTIRSNGSSLIDFIFGAGASGGTAAFFGVWNMYNRVLVGTSVVDSGASYTLGAAGWRQARASAGNQVTFVRGMAEDAVTATASSRIQTAASSLSQAFSGMALDSITAPNPQGVMVIAPTAAAYAGAPTSVAIYSPGLGLHYIARLEYSDGTTSTYNQASTDHLDVSIML